MAKLKVGGVVRPSVETVVQRHRSILKEMADDEAATSTGETAKKLLALLPEEGAGG